MVLKTYTAIGLITVLLMYYFSFSIYNNNNNNISSNILPLHSVRNSICDERQKERIVYIDRRNNTSFEEDRKNISEYIRQRNYLSRLLNTKQKLIGQMECEVVLCR